MSFSFRAGWQIEQAESGGRENNRPTDRPTPVPSWLHSKNRPSTFFFIYNTCMYKFRICMFYCYITRFPDGQCREKLRGAKKRGLSDVIYRRNHWGEQRGGTQCLDLNIVADQPRSDWEEETERRESRGLREDQQEQLVHKISFFFSLLLFTWSAALLASLGWLAGIFLSLPPTLQWRCDWPTLLQTGGLTVSFCGGEDRLWRIKKKQKHEVQQLKVRQWRC